jgi:RHS repeat-associated protein
VGGTTTTATYDRDGKRVSTTVRGVTTTYMYDVNTSLPVVLEDGHFTYFYGLGLAYAVEQSSGAVRVFHADGLGSVRAITNRDPQISVIETYQTDAFGNPTQTQGGVSQPFPITGQQRDASTGLYYLRARMYDPTTGRFLSRDPLAGVAAAPPTLNRFAYAGNNPVSSVDPSGLKNQALGPGPCLQQTIFGPFIFSSVFCSIFSQTRSKQQLRACPGGGGAPAYEQWVDNYYVQVRGPESGPQGCHVNLELRSGSNPVVNWHVFYSNNTYRATALSVVLLLVVNRSAAKIADVLVADVLGRIPVTKDFAAFAALANNLRPVLVTALRNLTQYQSGP